MPARRATVAAPVRNPDEDDPDGMVDRVERLTGLDASFLYLENRSLHMHVSMATVFDPSTVPGGYDYGRLRDVVASRLLAAPVFRRHLVRVPFGLGHPYWVDDEEFDIDYHVRRCALPAPGGMDELAAFVADVCSRQLDRSRPLWEMYIVEGVEHDRIAMVTKIHHCAIDGVSGAELLAQLFDLEPDPPQRPAPPAPRRPAREPSDAELVAHALLARLARPVEITRLAWKTGKGVFEMARLRQSPTPTRAALPLTTPRTSLNATITPHRRVAFASLSLDDVKRVKRAVGSTVNDVVLAVCTGALRRYLLQRDELPEQPLVATVPVSVATRSTIRGANKVSAMWVALPCGEPDPRRRVEIIHESTRSAKEEYNALGADVLADWTEHATPNVFAAAARAYTRFKLAEHHRPIHSLVISNVPGPDFPLYLGGAELVAAFPLGPIIDGAGLNVTVMSYRGALNWGLIACSETAPHLDDLADALAEALDELLAATGLAPAHRTGIASRRTGGAKRSRSRGASSRRASEPRRATSGAAASPRRL